MNDSRQAHQADSADITTPSDTSPYVHHPYETLKDCDIVMKGGITSGVVYPEAVYELSKYYRLHSVGGTSAGAIAAAAAAAAELGRSESGSDASFEKLKKLPGCLGETNSTTQKTTLFSFFQPQPETVPLFDTAVAFVGEDNGKVWRVLGAALRSFPLAALIGILPALFMIFFTFTPKNFVLGTIEFLLILLWAIIGCALALLVAFGVRTLTALKGNYFGFCTGMPSPRSGGYSTWPAKVKKQWNMLIGREAGVSEESQQKEPQALTEWLADYLDNLAGVTDARRPLTFGDLRWGLGKRNPTNEVNQRPDYKVAPAITLRMITSNLTLGRPYTLPFEPHIFYYDPKEWENFFPSRIMEWLETHAAQSDGRIIQNSAGTVLVPLPLADELPVIVATRMSLSFPILLCAVPMYVVDYERKINRSVKKDGESSAVENDINQEDGNAVELSQDNGPRRHFLAERCWFSDGGIAINFPVHFFDRPLPRWPTFAINLSTPHPERPLSSLKDEEKITMVKNNNEGISSVWNRLKEKPLHAPLLGFLGAIFYTARTWMDQTQLIAPGYRDRIVHILLDEQEGGLNLNMDRDLIKTLAARGGFAGKRIVENYALPTPPDHVINWDNHRWIRYRSSMTVMEELFDALDKGYSSEMTGYRSYDELIRRDRETPPKSYRLSDVKQRELAIENTDSLIALARSWKALQEEKKTKMAKGTPNPEPELQIRVRI